MTRLLSSASRVLVTVPTAREVHGGVGLEDSTVVCANGHDSAIGIGSSRFPDLQGGIRERLEIEKRCCLGPPITTELALIVFVWPR